MTLNIGGQQILVSVPFNRQNAVRTTEKEIESLFRSWNARFPGKTDRELLAMITYQYASYYHEMQEGLDRAFALAEDCLSRIDDAVADDNTDS